MTDDLADLIADYKQTKTTYYEARDELAIALAQQVDENIRRTGKPGMREMSIRFGVARNQLDRLDKLGRKLIGVENR